MKLFISAALIFTTNPLQTRAFSSNSSSQPPAFTLSDRFRAKCPADTYTIAQFDPNLIDDNSEDDKSTWVAIFRSSNNLPSVLVKDDFLNAMRIATTVQTDGAIGQSTPIDNASLSSQIEINTYQNSDERLSSDKRSNSSSSSSSGVKAQTPVAIAKLSPSPYFSNTYTIDTLRCSLKKEDQNESCDGNSEHAEALAICIDELLLYHLTNFADTGKHFDKSIRTKSTLVSARLLEERGFKEVESLERDMATHVSCLDASLIKFAERAVETVSKGPGARDRALKILNYLGRLDPMTEEEREIEKESIGGDEDDENDPWANIKQFI